MEATQEALFRLERWSEDWSLPLNPSKCEASFFSVDPHQANLQPNLLLLGSRLHFNPTPTFLGVTFDRTLSFSKHVSSLKAKFFPRFKALRCISASSWGPSKESLSVLYKSFLRSLLTYASPGLFPFLSATNLTKLERLHCAASRAITGCLSSSHILLLLFKASLPPLRVTLTHFTLFSYERALHLPTSFPISGLARLGVKLSLLARAAPTSLPTALSVALRPLFPFQLAQYAQVFPLKPTPFYTLFAGLGNTNKSAISPLFSYYLTLVLFSPPCSLLHLSSYLKLCGRSGRNCLLSPAVLSDYNGSPDTRFS